MMFRTIKAAIQTILANEAGGRYQVIGHQRQEKSGEEFLGVNRLVEIYFRESDFPKNKSRNNGPSNSDIKIAVELTVSAMAEGDLSVLLDENSTPAQIQPALLAIKEASAAADDSFDELAELIYQILCDGQYIEFNLTPGSVQNKHLNAIRKDQPNERGGVVTLTGIIEVMCSACEEKIGVPTTPFVNNDTVIQISDDEDTKTGIITPTP